MRAPKFWQHDGILAEVLFPASLFFYLYGLLRDAITKPTKMKVPVVCVGNIVAGGAGKTPTAIAIAKLLKKNKKKVAFISKGYGGKTRTPIRVDEKKHSYKDVGDEPLILSRVAPCWVGRCRVETAKAAIKDGAKVLILDDGFQDPSIEKNASFMVIDGGYGIGNGFIIPAGPLRGKFSSAIKNSKAIILIGLDKTNIWERIKNKKPKISARFVPVSKIRSQEKYLAFAGIGRPQKFSETLEEMGAKIVQTIAYPDHYPYKEKDISELKELAKKSKAKLITTEKDAVRIPKNLLKGIEVMKVEIEFKNEREILRFLEQSIR